MFANDEYTYKILIDTKTIRCFPGLTLEITTKEFPAVIAFLIKYNALYKDNFLRKYPIRMTTCSDGYYLITIEDIAKRDADVIEHQIVKNRGDVLNSQLQLKRNCTSTPRYLFEYTPTMIKCKYCESIFFHKYLRESHSIKNICPVCQKPEPCCTLEYQSIQDVTGSDVQTNARVYTTTYFI